MACWLQYLEERVLTSPQVFHHSIEYHRWTLVEFLEPEDAEFAPAKTLGLKEVGDFVMVALTVVKHEEMLHLHRTVQKIVLMIVLPRQKCAEAQLDVDHMKLPWVHASFFRTPSL